MPRPERFLDPDAGPVQSLAADLRALRRQFGNPGYRQLADRVGYSVSALANAAGGRQLPSLAVTLAFVQACGGETAGWEQQWRRAAAEWAVRQANGSRPSDGERGAEPPYRGLAGYGVGDADRFFGRDRLVAQLVAMLSTRRFVAVFGVSGSGKSSLLRAGLIPALGAEPGAPGAIEETARPVAVVITPGSAPSAALREALGSLPPEREILLVVDQFEELFTLCRDAAERTDFVAALEALIADSGSWNRIVIGVRADFYARCAELPRLGALLAGANVPVGPLSEQELSEVITKPARRAGLRVERALVTKVVAEATGQAGALPLVSHALLETWRQRRGDVLGVVGYEAAGGVAGAVARTAEAVYARLDPRRRETAREILIRLVNLGDGAEDTRRRALRAELDLPGVDAVLDELAGARLVVLGPRTVEIAHEALINAWPRLHDWLHADRQSLQLHRQLTDAAELWRRLDHDPGALYRGSRLTTWDGRSTHGLNPLELEFLTASRSSQAREQRTRRRRVRCAVVGLTAGLIVMSVLAGFALVQARRADSERDLAVSRQLVGAARDQLQVDQEVALLLAMRAYDTRPTSEAEAVLRRAVADSRVRAVVPAGHDRVFGVAYRRDGGRLATSGADGNVRLWDITGPDAAPEPLRVLSAHTGDVWSPTFSPDGHRLAACGIDGTVTVWDLRTDAAAVVLHGHRGVVSNVAFSADGSRLASAGGDGTVRVWDANGIGDPLVLAVGTTPLGVAFSPDGRHLAASGENGSIWIWDSSGRGEPRVLRGHEGSIEHIAFSHDGQRLASGGSDGTVRVWRVDDGSLPVTLRGNDGYVESVAFSPDGQRVASGHSDGSNAIRVWNITGGEDPVVMYGHDGPVWSVAFSPNGRRLASASSDGTARIWDPADVGEPSVLKGHAGPAWNVAVDRDGERMVSGGQDGTVRVWRRPDRPEPLVLEGHQGDVFGVAISADGRRAASAGRDRTVRLWDASDGRQLQVFEGNERGAMAVALSPDGHRVASAGTDGTVRIWHTRGDAGPIVLRGHDGAVRNVAFSPDGRRVASSGADGTVRVWNADGRGQPVVLRDGPIGLIWCVAFSSDGRRLAVGGHDGLLRIWDTDGRGKPLALRGHHGNVWSVAFSPDDRFLVSGGEDGGLRFWHVVDGAAVVELRGHTSLVHRATFVPKGAGPSGSGGFASGGPGFDRYGLATANDDGTVRLWHCDVCGPIDRVRAVAETRVSRPLSPDERRAFLGERAS